jgi:HEAT repeat protein
VRLPGVIMTGRSWLGAALMLILLCSSASAQGPAPLSNADGALAQLGKDLADQSLPVAQRLEIVRALGGWGTAQVRAPLLAALKDPSAELRAAAARALGWANNREAVPALRERFEASDEVSMVKGAAVESLGAIADPAVRPLLVSATKHADAGVRQAALWALALGPFVEPADRTSYLIQLAEDRAALGLLRCDAIRALFTVKEDRVIDAFMRILESEPRFAMALPEGPGNQQQIMELRRVQARDAAAWVAEGLGQLKAKSATPLLLKTAEDKSDYFLRLMSLRSLIILEAPEARPVLLGRLADPVPDIRILALMGLTSQGDRTVINAVLGRLTDPSPLVRIQAVVAAATLGDATVRPTLESLQRIELESSVQAAIDEALHRLPR